MEKCAVKGCKSKQVDIDYLGKPICGKCWAKFSEKPVNVLRAALGMKLLDEVVIKEEAHEGVHGQVGA